MQIRFGKYGINASGGCFTLVEYRIVQAREEGDGGRGKAPKPENIGKERETAVSFHGSIEAALKKMFEYGISESEATTVEGLLQYITQVMGWVSQAAAEIGKTAQAGKADDSE